MESLKESLIKNIKQDDKSIKDSWMKWVNEINNYFIERYVGLKKLVYGEDYEINHKGVLNYKNGVKGGEIWMDISTKDLYLRMHQSPPPSGLKLGRMWKSNNPASHNNFRIGLWYLDIKDLDEIIDPSYEGTLYIHCCKNLDHVDLTKYPRVKIVDISGCKLKYVKLPKYMQRVSISGDVEKIYGCEEAKDFTINHINHLKSGTIEFPKKIRTFNIANSKLRDYSNFPEEVFWFESYKSLINGGNITKKRLAKVTKFDHYTLRNR